jgi:hypothetical protein
LIKFVCGCISVTDAIGLAADARTNGTTLVLFVARLVCSFSHQGPRVAAARSIWRTCISPIGRHVQEVPVQTKARPPFSCRVLDNVESRMRCQGTGRLGSHRGGSADRCRLIHRVRADRSTDSGSRRGVRPGTTLKPSFQLSQARYLLTQKGRICATVLV